MSKPPALNIDVLVTLCESARLLNSHAALSRRQAAMVAVVLNRWDWLWNMDFTIVTAIQYIGDNGMKIVCQAEQRIFRNTP